MQMLREALLLLDDHRFRVADHVVKRLEVSSFGAFLCECVCFVLCCFCRHKFWALFGSACFACCVVLLVLSYR